VLKVLLSIGAIQFVTMFVLMLRTKGLALLLGPELYGLMGALDRLVAVFAQTAALSLPFAALRYLSPLWHDDRSAFFGLLRRMRNVLAGTVGVGLVVGAVILLRAPDFLGDHAGMNRELALLALAGLPVVVLVPFLQNTIAASFDPARAMLFWLGNAVLFSVTAVVGVWLWGLAGFYSLYAASGLVLVAWALRSVLSLETPADRAQTPKPERLYLPPRVWRFGLLMLTPAFLAPAVAYGVFTRVISTDGQIAGGYMQSAMGVALAVRNILGAAGQVFLTPLVNRSGAFEERVDRANEFQKTLFFLVGIGVPPIIVLGETALIVLYSAKFAPAAPYVVWFVATEVLALAVGNYQAVLLAMEHVGISVIQNIVAQLGMLAVAVISIPILGITGAALAGLTAQLVLMVGTGGFLAFRYGFRPNLRVLLLSAYVFSMLGVCGWAAIAFPGLSPRAVAIKVVLNLGMMLGLAMFPSRQDWRNIARLKDELRARLGGAAR
jgi:O-antigen/teichoic acid export membrane protein